MKIIINDQAVIIIDIFCIMNSNIQDKRAAYIQERNHKISSILVLLITIFEKIERLKQKLCGFSPTQFSPQSIFEALDLTGKGYLDVYDIHSFLGNQRIRDKDILILFSRLGDQGQGRLTYLGYLALLKPFFNYDLARDLLLRDTITHRKNRDNEDQSSLHQMQQTVLILLNQLILLHCICIAEHEDLKTALIEEYMLNEIEIKQIIGFGGKVGAITALYQFIQCNSEYEVSKDEVKYILSLTQCNQPSLPQDRFINILFIPSRANQKKTKKETQGKLKNKYQMESLHANYTKNYLGKADLFNTSNRLSFLNYIHPNSYHNPINDNTNKKQQQLIKEEVQIYQQHKKIQVPQQKINRPFKMDKKPQQQKMTQSIVQKSNLQQIRKDSSRFQPVSYERIQTPVLQQFMHESNIKRNMGNYRGKQEKLQLKQLIEESQLSESSAFIREDYKPKGPPPIKITPQNKGYYQPILEQRSQFINKFPNNRPSNTYDQNKSNLSNGDTSGILNQFLKSQFR